VLYAFAFAFAFCQSSMKYFMRDFVIHADFTDIAASNAVIDDITN